MVCVVVIVIVETILGIASDPSGGPSPPRDVGCLRARSVHVQSCMSIVCGTDFGDAARAASLLAAGLARRLGVPLLLVHAPDLPVSFPLLGEPVTIDPAILHPIRARAEAHADQTLAAEATSIARETGAVVTPRLGFGRPDDTILEAAQEGAAELVVAGLSGRGPIARALLGSTTDRLARRSSRPLLVARGDTRGFSAWAGAGAAPLRVLVGVEFERPFESIAGVVRLLRRAGPCDVHFAHVMPEPLSGEALAGMPITPSDVAGRIDRALAERAAAAGVPVAPERMHRVDGAPADALSQLAREQAIDVVVVGSRARAGLERALLGSTALGLLHGAPVPVVIVP